MSAKQTARLWMDTTSPECVRSYARVIIKMKTDRYVGISRMFHGSEVKPPVFIRLVNVSSSLSRNSFS